MIMDTLNGYRSSRKNKWRPSRLMLLVSMLVLLANNYIRWNTDNSQQLDNGRKFLSSLGRPEPLLNYEDFHAIYPVDKCCSGVENSHRNIVFILDLIGISQTNLATLARRQTYFLQQTPFTSNRMALEQDELIKSTDMLHLLAYQLKPQETSDSTEEGLVSGPTGTVKLETGRMNGWWKRITKGDSFFDIPSFPLDNQPNPNQVTHIDADLRYCLGKIKDQKICGACYAFSWNSLAEWHYCRQTGRHINFSEQHIIDCGAVVRLVDGCVSGRLPNARDFSAAFGFFLEQDYPYMAKRGSCKSLEGSIKVKTTFIRILVDRFEWEKVLEEQPILVEARVPKDILKYSRGIHPGTNCDDNLSHGMLLVGHGRQDGIPYWLLRNSMGRKWGENGYLRLARDGPMNECFKNGFLAKLKFNSVDDEHFDEFYQSIKYTPSVYLVHEDGREYKARA